MFIKNFFEDSKKVKLDILYQNAIYLLTPDEKILMSVQLKGYWCQYNSTQLSTTHLFFGSSLDKV